MPAVSACKICEADFRIGVLVDGKCKACSALYPKCNSKQEAQQAHEPVNKMGDELNETRVASMIADMLDQRLNPLVEKMDALLSKKGPGRPPNVKETK